MQARCGTHRSFVLFRSPFAVQPNRHCRTHVPRAVATPVAAASSLEDACTVREAAIGINAAGYRGLIAQRHLPAGHVVVSLPLHNILQVPRAGTLATMQATSEALHRWQQCHGKLPKELTDLIMDPNCLWEAKLVAWLLHLQALSSSSSSSSSTLWDAYCQALPAAQDTLSFFCYSPEQAEQLQFRNWKALAATQHQLLLQVYQHISSCFSNSSSTQDRTPAQADVAWALTMVKSRTFGRPVAAHHNLALTAHHNLKQQQQKQLQQEQQQQQLQCAGVGSAALPHTTCEQPAAAAAGEVGFQAGVALGSTPLQSLAPGSSSRAQEVLHREELEQEGDDSDIVLLMVPFIDMVNHAQDNNCVFGIDWATGSFELTALRPITAGEEVTICYGSNKSNLALLSCYGFFIPGNVNDAQLLKPMFSSCLAAAQGVQGFEERFIKEALALLAAPLVTSTKAAVDGSSSSSSSSSSSRSCSEDSTGRLQAARRRCAAAALPLAASGAGALQETDAQRECDSSGLEVCDEAVQKEQRKQLQLQRYLAELLLHQVQLVLRLSGTTAEEDEILLQQLHAAGSGPLGLDQLSLRQAVAARLDQKLLLLECQSLLKHLLEALGRP